MSLSTALKSHNLVIRVVSLFLATLVLSSASISANNVAPTIAASLPVAHLAAASPSVAPKITIISHPTASLPSQAPPKSVAPATATKLVIHTDKTDAPVVIHSSVGSQKIVAVPSSSPTPLVATLNVTGASAAGVAAQAVHAAAVTSAPAPAGASIIVKPLGEHSNEIAHKFCDFLKPICESVDKIPPKQLFQIQTQFKKIVQSSAGKLSICFLEHYKINPNLKPITKAELIAVCSSKNLAPEVKGSYKAFQACASKNWDASIDKELDHIEADRQEFIKSHKHAKNDSNVENLVHEDDEFSLISEVIGQVLDNKSLTNRSDVKLIDFSNAPPPTVKPAAVVVAGPAKASTVSPVLTVHSTIPVTVAASVVKHSNISTSSPQGVKEMMNDPNTVLVLVDDSNATALPTTLPPTLAKKAPLTTVKATVLLAPSAKPTVKISIVAGTTTAAPAATISIESSTNKTKTTSKSGSLADKLLNATLTTTIKPLVALSSSAKPTVVTTSTNTTVKISGPTTTTTSAPSLAAAIKKALVGNSTATPTTVAAKVTVKSKLETTNATTIKPLKTIQTVLVKQEKEKENLEAKLKLERERVMKDLMKKQDEIDAQNAIKALQAQRQAQAHADIKLHQIEHERQMQIDPIGHSFKHQQYEISKHQKMMQAGRK